MATVAFFLEAYQKSTFVMTYQDRNILYCIHDSLEHWKLKAKYIPFKDFGFDPSAVLSINDPSIINDFPSEDVENVLITMEITRLDNSFVF